MARDRGREPEDRRLHMTAMKNTSLHQVIEAVGGRFEGEIVPGADLTRYNSFELPGSCEFLVIPRRVEDTVALIRECARCRVPLRYLGGGTNIVLPPDPIQAIVLLFSRVAGEIRQQGNTVTAPGGLSLQRLLRCTVDGGLGGLEFLAGIPGTVGGAVAGNAGSAEHGIGEFVSRIWILDAASGRERVLTASRAGFGYRTSRFGQGGGGDAEGTGKAGRDAVLRVEFSLRERDPVLLKERYLEYHREKTAKQPLWMASAGCIFRNPRGAKAGRLIDRCGLKGAAIGGAAVSGVHANFIVNTGNATPDDVLSLIDHVRETVRVKTGVHLELEVEIW